MNETEYPTILRKAADHIERVGLNKDGGFFEGVDPELVDGLTLVDPYQLEAQDPEWFNVADYLEENPNWAQTKADIAERPLAERPCCTLGAIQVAAGGDYHYTLATAVRERLGNPWGGAVHVWSIPDWNDLPERTVEDVARLLRETAADLEQKVGGQ